MYSIPLSPTVFLFGVPIISNLLRKKLSKEHLKIKLKGYLGSEQIEFSENNEASIDAFEHYFSNSADCKAAVKQLQKEYGYLHLI